MPAYYFIMYKEATVSDSTRLVKQQQRLLASRLQWRSVGTSVGCISEQCMRSSWSTLLIWQAGRQAVPSSERDDWKVLRMDGVM